MPIWKKKKIELLKNKKQEEENIKNTKKEKSKKNHFFTNLLSSVLPIPSTMIHSLQSVVVQSL
jgi:hypothetical protein